LSPPLRIAKLSPSEHHGPFYQQLPDTFVTVIASTHLELLKALIAFIVGVGVAFDHRGISIAL
jgi:hypothetical protein